MVYYFILLWFIILFLSLLCPEETTEELYGEKLKVHQV